MSIFDIDDTVYCVFCAISDIQSMMSLLQVDQRCYRTYRLLTQKDIRNNVVRKYWRDNLNTTRLIYNRLLTVNKLCYVDGRDMIAKYLANLFNDTESRNKFISIIERFVFDATCTQLVIVGEGGTGKSLLKEIIVPLFNLRYYNIEFDTAITKCLVSDTNEYIICSHAFNIVNKDDLPAKAPGYKYIIDTYRMSADLDVPKIILTNYHRDSSLPHFLSIITNELFSMIVDN